MIDIIVSTIITMISVFSGSLAIGQAISAKAKKENRRKKIICFVAVFVLSLCLKLFDSCKVYLRFIMSTAKWKNHWLHV